MKKRLLWSCAAAALFLIGAAFAQHPMLDMIANNLVTHYQQSSCEQLWQERARRQGKPKSQQEMDLVALLRQDAQMRTEFLGRVATPIVTKEFECGMIP